MERLRKTKLLPEMVEASPEVPSPAKTPKRY